MAQDHILVEEQHPIPQQISAFQFRLVGDMTLKQFVQLAGGAIIALLFYASGLPPFIKWPLILFSFGSGAALAFLPLEDRPLGKWVISFFKSIYSPTVFVWQKAAKLPSYFAPETQAPPTAAPASQPANTPVILPVQKPESNLEKKEQTFLDKITTLSSTPVATVVSGVSPLLTPKTTMPTQEPTQQTKPFVVVPSSRTVSVDKDLKTRGFELPKEEDIAEPFSTTTVSPFYGKGVPITDREAKFSDEASPPTPPTRPNTIVGQVMDDSGKIIEGVILEIKDAQGRPVRALKTNKLGHFMIVTPLLDGRYEIIVEKEGYDFEPITFQAKGAIISPIAIRAK